MKKIVFTSLLIILCCLFLSSCFLGSNSSSSKSPDLRPKAPTGLTATSGDRQVKLSWQAVSSINERVTIRYEYQQSLTRDRFDNIWVPIPGGERTREVIVSDLTDGTTYFFRVRAVNIEGAGEPSTEVGTLAYDGPTAEPGASPSLTATPGDSQVVLSWQTPMNMGASVITGYEYQQSITNGQFGDTWISVSESTREVIVSGLTSGTTYYFRVRAINAEGVGVSSAEISAIPSDELTSQLRAPVALTGVPGNRQVMLSWQAPSTADVSVIAGYEYQQSIDGEFGNTWVSVSRNTHEVIVSGLTGGTYYFRVRAINTEGRGAFSEVNTISYDGPTVKPGTPIALTAVPGDRQVTLSWQAPMTVGASSITGYEYQQNMHSTLGNTWISVSGGENQVIILGLVSETTYYFRVRAVNSYGAGVASIEVVAVSNSEQVTQLGAPRDLISTPGDRSITLSWNPPSSMGTSAITRYEYQQSTTSSGFDDINIWIPVSGEGSAREVTVSDLTGATTYYFRVRAVNDDGGGNFAEMNTLVYDGPTAYPGAPPLSSISGDHQVTLNWEAPSTIGALAIIRYEYQQSETSGQFGSTWTSISGGANVREATISGLKGMTTYYFRMRAVNSYGEGTSSAEISTITYDGLTAEPGPPGNLTTISGDRQVTLNWEASRAGASVVTGYEYQQSEIGGQFGSTWTSISGGASVREVTISNLTAMTTYYFRIRAINSYGVGAFEEISAVAYDGPTPGPGSIRNLVATSGDHQVTLNWEEPSTMGASTIIGYEYQQSETSGQFGSTWTSISGGESIREIAISSLTGAITHYFRVRAINSDDGGASSEVSAVAYDGPIPEPGPPTNLVATGGERQVTLSWNSPSTLGASAITSYEYQQSTTSGGFEDTDTWTSVVGNGGAREVIVSDLTGGVTSYFRMRAVNDYGVGEASTEVSAKPAHQLEPDLAICSDPGTTDEALPGTGEESDPFILCSSAHLGLIGDVEFNAEYTLSAHYSMGQDIDLNNQLFQPIAGTFTGFFDGRGKQIMNLNINNNGRGALFYELGSDGSIKNLGIKEFNVKGVGRVAALVAVNSGTITNCYGVDSDSAIDVLGQSINSIDNLEYIGGLVGAQSAGRIVSSYTKGDVSGGDSGGGYKRIGGLVGRQDGGFIISSYATGDVIGGDGTEEAIGGLVGHQSGATIISSYATGEVEGQGGSADRVGGLVGYQSSGATIISSYATGGVSGGSGIIDKAGGLVGDQDGALTLTIFSYATGNVAGGGNIGDSAAPLVGSYLSGDIISSYGFGSSNGGSSNTYGTPPSGVTSASDLTQANSASSENNRWSTEAWNFGSTSQAPALKYVDNYGDHDNDVDTADDYSCTSSGAFWPSITIICGTTLLPEQGR